ncbi:ImmA/IrrE family metallo-endopeptidase [Phascolarctobacterium sp.]|uniref:ImmA/IrrE family metallo-endopeptidase n=1 Tax=Phascolarctobacterium sp. TaxID=2049039 RepID=UPI00386FEE06
MIYYKLSPTQLEAEAEKLLTKFDKELLTKAKLIDVYAVIEKCLDVPYDWKYITPDQSILGLTAFNAGSTWVWEIPDNQLHQFKCYQSLFENRLSETELKSLNGMIPRSIYLEKGTILIDSSLTESANRGRENFTVMHEVFHQVIHKNCFRRERPNYTHQSTQKALNGKKCLKTALDYIEYQANSCAAAFLMPKDLLIRTYRKCYSSNNRLSADSYQAKRIIKVLAPEFNASEQAMKYRLLNLGLLC